MFLGGNDKTRDLGLGCSLAAFIKNCVINCISFVSNNLLLGIYPNEIIQEKKKLYEQRFILYLTTIY